MEKLGLGRVRFEEVDSVWGLQTQHSPNSLLYIVVQFLGRQQLGSWIYRPGAQRNSLGKGEIRKLATFRWHCTMGGVHSPRAGRMRPTRGWKDRSSVGK